VGFLYRSWYILVNCLEENLHRKPADVTISLFLVEVWIHLCMDLFFSQGLAALRILTQSPERCLGDSDVLTIVICKAFSTQLFDTLHFSERNCMFAHKIIMKYSPPTFCAGLKFVVLVNLGL